MKIRYLKTAIAGASIALATQAGAAPTLNWDWLMVSAWDSPVLTGTQADLTQSRAINYTVGTGNISGHASIGWGQGTSGQSQLIIADPAKTSDGALTGITAGTEVDSPTFNEANPAYGIAGGERDPLVLAETSPGIWTASTIGTTYFHLNNIVASTSDTLLTVNLAQMLFLTPEPTMSGPVFEPLINPGALNIHFLETVNDGSCEVGAAGPGGTCDDIFVVTNPGQLTFGFHYDGYAYEFLMVNQDPDPEGDDTGLTPLPDTACDAVGANSVPSGQCYGLVTSEGVDNRFAFNLTLTARELAEPSVLALVGLGLLGAVYVRRRIVCK
ncbi:MAG: THxN family PEP-CTERM protein [Parahaliea sp.]